MRELLEVVVAAPFEKLLDRAGDASVEPRPLRHAELLVERLPHEGVGERIAPQRLGDLGYEPCRRRLVDQLEELSARELVDVLRHFRGDLVVDRAPEQVDLELAPDHGGPGQDEVALVRELVEAAANDLADPLRNSHEHVAQVARPVQPALRGEQAHDLGDEERVPLGLLVDCAHQLRARLNVRGHLDEARHVRLAQAAEDDALHKALSGQVREHLGQRVAAAELDVAVGPDHEDPGVADLAREEMQHQQGRRVGPMQVVEDQHERVATRDVLQEGRDAVEEAEPRLLRIRRVRRFREAGDEVAQL